MKKLRGSCETNSELTAILPGRDACMYYSYMDHNLCANSGATSHICSDSSPNEHLSDKQHLDDNQ